MNKEELIRFELDIKQMYLDGKIRSPIHLSGGNEDELIEIFKEIKDDDWVFTTYRSHYHALLKGVDPDWLKDWILRNKSIHVMSKLHKIVTSAIVGGTLSQALGCALAIKLKNHNNYVWCFCGDMAYETGNFMEVRKYAERNNLPINFIVEDNGLSVDTPTQETWGTSSLESKVRKYKYERIYPHYGVGVFVDFKDEGLIQDGKRF